MSDGRTNGERVDAGEPLTEAWVAMMELHQALGAAPVGGRLWSVDVDERWRITVNGMQTPQDIGGTSLAPVSMFIEYNGWPAGICDLFGGVIAAGEAANEDTFIEAVRAAVRRQGVQEGLGL